MTLNNLIPINRQRRRGTTLPQRRRSEHPLGWLQEEMNRLFDEYLPESHRGGRLPDVFAGGDWDFAPDVDVRETKKAIHVKAELPGVNEDDIDVRIEGNVLTLRGEKREEKTEKEGGWTHAECAYGSFVRSIPLGVEVEYDGIDATFKKGVLKVTLPKAKPGEEHAGLIDVKGE